MAQNPQNRHSIHPWRVWSIPALVGARTTIKDTKWNRIGHPEVFQVHKRDRRWEFTQNSLHIRSSKSWAWLLPRHELYSRLSLPFPWWWGSSFRCHAPDNPSLRAEHFVQHRASNVEAELLSTGQTDFHTPARPSRTLKRRECEQQLFQFVLLHHAFYANNAAPALQREYVEATAHLGLLHNRKCSQKRPIFENFNDWWSYWRNTVVLTDLSTKTNFSFHFSRTVGRQSSKRAYWSCSNSKSSSSIWALSRCYLRCQTCSRSSSFAKWRVLQKARLSRRKISGSLSRADNSTEALARWKCPPSYSSD